MAYNELRKQATMRYLKDKQQDIRIRFKKDFYNESIKPAIDDSGLPTATYIKKAIVEKIERDYSRS